MDAIQAESFAGYLAEVGRKLESEPMPEAMENAKKTMQAGQADNFTRQSSREGSSWPARKPPTGTWPLLNKSGALLGAASGTGPGATQEVTGRSATIGVDKSVKQGGIPGAGVHQFGFAEKNIPARPWLGASDEIEAAIGEMFADEGLKFFLWQPY